MRLIKYLTLIFMTMFVGVNVLSCSDNDEPVNKEYDGTLIGEWVEATGGQYYREYYYFGSDGTGTQGVYDLDLEWAEDEEDIFWFTSEDKYLYIDGAKCEYWCDGSSLEIRRNGKTKRYRAL